MSYVLSEFLDGDLYSGLTSILSVTMVQMVHTCEECCDNDNTMTITEAPGRRQRLACQVRGEEATLDNSGFPATKRVLSQALT